MEEQGKILVAVEDGHCLIRLLGEARLTLAASMARYIDSLQSQQGLQSVMVDLNDCDTVDSTMLGLLAKLATHVREWFGLPVSIVCANPDINRVLESMGFEQIFILIDHRKGIPPQLDTLPVEPASEEETRRTVLEAHRLLMSLNEENAERFRNLVEMLE